jgi:hypothetical protein
MDKGWIEGEDGVLYVPEYRTAAGIAVETEIVNGVYVPVLETPVRKNGGWMNND